MRENDLSLQLALKAQKPQGRIRAANAKCRFETIRQKDPTATRPIWSADVGRRARLVVDGRIVGILWVGLKERAFECGTKRAAFIS